VPPAPLPPSPPPPPHHTAYVLPVCPGRLQAIDRLGGLEAAKPKAVLELLAAEFPNLTTLVRLGGWLPLPPAVLLLHCVWRCGYAPRIYAWAARCGNATALPSPPPRFWCLPYSCLACSKSVHTWRTTACGWRVCQMQRARLRCQQLPRNGLAGKAGTAEHATRSHKGRGAKWGKARQRACLPAKALMPHCPALLCCPTLCCAAWRLQAGGGV
jgi:hypothetical protein